MNRNHREDFVPEGFTEEHLTNWYRIFKPGGSGLSPVVNKIICSLIEEVAQAKGIEL